MEVMSIDCVTHEPHSYTPPLTPPLLSPDDDDDAFTKGTSDREQMLRCVVVTTATRSFLDDASTIEGAMLLLLLLVIVVMLLLSTTAAEVGTSAVDLVVVVCDERPRRFLSVLFLVEAMGCIGGVGFEAKLDDVEATDGVDAGMSIELQGSGSTTTAPTITTHSSQKGLLSGSPTPPAWLL